MKKNLMIIFVFASSSILAQNLQVHYDFGKDREYLTTTLEMFKPDKLGNTFFFVDMDYNVGDVKGISLAYMEIARVLKTEEMPVGIHVEYNGGFGQFNVDSTNLGYRINDSWLAGIDYSINADDFSKGISFKAMYKHIVDKQDVSFQLTTVWYLHFLNKRMTFSGFADFWKEDSDFNFDGKTDSEFIFIAEPQLWYHINNHFSLGSEIEFSNNFANMEGFNVMPTLGAKWIF
jgi:hypothetical protein